MHVAGASTSRLTTWIHLENRSDAWASYGALALAGLVSMAWLLL